MRGDATTVPRLSVVVPLYDEEATVGELVDRLGRALDGMGLAGEAEVILVDDGSRDRTWAMIRRAHARDPRFVGLALSRNFGHQAALSAGLARARGDAVVLMDGDLQDPPEAIPALWERFADGYDVVYAIRTSRPEGPWKRLAYGAFYRLLSSAGSLPIPRHAGDFGIMSRRVVDLIVALPERRRFVRGLRAWAGFRQAGVPVPRARRHAGRPKFTVAKLVGLALDGLIGFGESPLRAAAPLGLLAMAASVLALAGGGVWSWRGGQGFPLGVAIAASTGFFGGVQLLCAAILGEYMSRIFQEVAGRPPYVIGGRLDPVRPSRPAGPHGRRHRTDGPHPFGRDEAPPAIDPTESITPAERS